MEDGLGGKRKKKKKRRRNGNHIQEPSTIHEVCLNDFANAHDKKEALKKISKKMISCSGSNGISKLTEKLNITTTNELWFERSDSDDSQTELDYETKEYVEIPPRLLKSKTQVIDLGREKSYPFDVWCILSTYIKPEQIQTFSGICRCSYEAVNCVRFWIRLYKKFILDPTCLPARLKPDWIESRPGLKMRIVRALFIGYNNLRNRLKMEDIAKSRTTQTVSQLIGLKCCRMWFEASTKPTYTFYFKFKLNQNQMVSNSLLSSDREDYLTQNNECQFIILKIGIANFIRLNSVCGETLTDISVNLSRNMRYNSVKLMFHYYRKDGRYRKEEGTRVIIDPVSNICLLLWWHPSYPHCDK